MDENEVGVGDVVAHKLLPDFPMTVLEVRTCETDPYGPHVAVRIVDPEDNPDWLCTRTLFLVDRAEPVG